VLLQKLLKNSCLNIIYLIDMAISKVTFDTPNFKLW